MQKTKTIMLSSEWFNEVVERGVLYVKREEYDFNIGDYILIRETNNGRFTENHVKVRLFFEIKEQFCPDDYRIAKVVIV